MPVDVVLAIVVGLAIGVVVGALGAGGGILSVPVLVFILGQNPHSATASSLVIVALTAMTSIIHHARVRNVAWKGGAIFGGISVVAAVLGARASAAVHPTVLLILFACMLTIVAIAMAFRAAATRRQENERPIVKPGTASAANEQARIETALTADQASASDDDASASESDSEIGSAAAEAAHGAFRPRSWWALIAAASCTGFLTGFFGVGGGFMVVPMLVLGLGLAMRLASGTSLLVMIIATIASLLGRIGTDVSIDWTITLLFAVGSMAGGLLGGPLSAKARPSTLTWLFAALLAIVAVGTFAGVFLG